MGSAKHSSAAPAARFGTRTPTPPTLAARAHLRRPRRPATGDRGLRAATAGAAAARLRTSQHGDPHLGRRRGRARRGRHLRRRRPHRPPGRRPDARPHRLRRPWASSASWWQRRTPSRPSRSATSRALYRRWAFESAALDLALRQAGKGLAEVARPRAAAGQLRRLDAPRLPRASASSIDAAAAQARPLPRPALQARPDQRLDRRADRRAGRDRRRRLARPQGLLQGHAWSTSRPTPSSTPS